MPVTPSLAHLAATDPDLRRALDAVGPPEPRIRPPGFATLLRIVVEQQVSSAAGAAIWSRLESGLGIVTPDAVLARDADALRAFGLSRPKARYAHALAEAVQSGALDLDAMAGLADEDALASLTAVKGIGTWTAEIYLMFALGRPDLWPVKDLALASAVAHLKGLAERPGPGLLGEIAEPWRPYRSTAALLCWRWYRFVRSGAPPLRPAGP